MPWISGGSGGGGGVSIPAASATLPGSPATGALAVLTDSTAAPTYQWLLVYDSGISGTSKWRFLGGDAFNKVAVGECECNAGVTTYQSLAVGTPPSMTLPALGTYVFEFGATIWVSTNLTQPTNGWLACRFGAAATVDADGQRVANYSPAASGMQTTIFRQMVRTVTATGVTVEARSTTTSGAGVLWSFDPIWLRATPVLLG